MSWKFNEMLQQKLRTLFMLFSEYPITAFIEAWHALSDAAHKYPVRTFRIVLSSGGN